MAALRCRRLAGAWTSSRPSQRGRNIANRSRPCKRAGLRQDAPKRIAEQGPRRVAAGIDSARRNRRWTMPGNRVKLDFNRVRGAPLKPDVSGDPSRRNPSLPPSSFLFPGRVEPASIPLLSPSRGRRMAGLRHRPSPRDRLLLGVPQQPRAADLLDNEIFERRPDPRLSRRRRWPANQAGQGLSGSSCHPGAPASRRLLIHLSPGSACITSSSRVEYPIH